MAQTTTPTAATVAQWDAKYFKDYLNNNFFKVFMGTGSGAMIQVNEELTKKPGDSVTFHLVNRLTNNATTGSNTLEGNEEDMTIRTFKVTIDQYRHATKYPAFEAQKSAIDFRNAHKDVLSDWNMELDRDKIIEALGSKNGVAYGTATEVQKDAWLVDNADRVLFGAAKSNNAANDHSAALAEIDNTADQLDSDALTLMKRLAKTSSPKIRPFKAKKSIGGSDGYVLFAPSLLMRDLTTDSSFVQANREARQRGLKNPLFTGADYIYDNIAIYEIEDIGVISGAGAAGIDVAPCYLCGAQALSWAWGKRPETVSDDFDYGDKRGLAVRQWYEIKKALFGTGTGDTDDLKDHGVFTGYFAAVADA